MSAQATKRRKKNYYVGSASKKAKANSLDSTTGPGFLVTINPKQERRATLQAYSLLNEAADRLYGAEEKRAGDDIEAELKNLRENNFRFQKVRTDFSSNVFIKSSIGKPMDICTNLFEHMTNNISHILRLVPVLGTSKSQQEAVTKKVVDILAEQYPVVLAKQSFMVQLKARQNNDYNSSEERRKYCLELSKKIQEWNAEFVPDLKQPDLVVHIDVLKRVTCISLLTEYNKFKKYNPEQFNDKVSTDSKPAEDGVLADSSNKHPEQGDTEATEGVRKSEDDGKNTESSDNPGHSSETPVEPTEDANASTETPEKSKST